MTFLRAITGLLILSLSACRQSETLPGRDSHTEPSKVAGPITARADLRAGNGGNVGVVTFESAGDPFFGFETRSTSPNATTGPSGFALPDAVIIQIDLKHLPTGSYRMHIHDTGKCEPPDFKTTGRHFPGYSDDVFKVESDGVHHTNSLSNEFKLRPGTDSILSKALVIHVLPSGKAPSQEDAEPIIACGTVAQQSGKQ